jgi:hypothetical protein
MIAGATFGPSSGRVRPLRFVRRSSIPLGAACVVANGIRETLRELLGEACEVVLGEPAAIGAEAWSVLTRNALLFLTRGRQTDIVLVLPKRDARRLVLRAFGERSPRDGPELPDAACSVLEAHALERIAARCAAAFDPLCSERRGASQPVAARDVPVCVAYFDVRVHAPIELTLGIGIVRDLPDPGPAGSLPAGVLDAVALELRAVFAEGTIDTAAFVRIRPGDIVKLNTKVGAPAFLNVAGHRVATGAAGVIASRSAVCVSGIPGALNR